MILTNLLLSLIFEQEASQLAVTPDRLTVSNSKELAFINLFEYDNILPNL